ncbi:TIGR01244 family sulfur transferase [Acidimangrovimonas sediminis]|uniref:TIGR01244 family sulfur transferase n=1 Tax=Acidimangrovimonas sediminis TaxID=2056283 RepID=UPI000C7F8655|nr:TIGR01244 family sulfur transferase [Acidimangrovimonas sediminis]
MDIRQIAETYAVSPQIDPGDVALIREAGFTTLICNRPDAEIEPTHRAAAIRALAEAEGLRFVENPVLPGQLTMDNVKTQDAAMAESAGPVLAYCASGNRSTIVWGLCQAGRQPTDALVAAAAAQGYNLEVWRQQLDALAAQRGGAAG